MSKNNYKKIGKMFHEVFGFSLRWVKKTKTACKNFVSEKFTKKSTTKTVFSRFVCHLNTTKSIGEKISPVTVLTSDPPTCLPWGPRFCSFAGPACLLAFAFGFWAWMH
jgi:hypothetical protein